MKWMKLTVKRVLYEWAIVNGWVSRIVQSVENEETGISRKFESQGVVVRLMQPPDTGFGKRHSSWSTEVALPSFSVLGKT